MKVNFFLVLMLVCLTGCQAQSQQNMEEKNTNPLLCDPAVGACEVPTEKAEGEAKLPHTQKTIQVIYFTDPICSSCWGIEPQLRKLKLEYGNQLDIRYHMGGLLPDWSYNSGGISKPSDVAHHWDEVSVHYDMPIDGDVWLEDPLDSSYPPSIAVKAAQMQDPKKAIAFLREIREMVFLHKKNITKWEHLEEAARKVGLDPGQMKQDVAGKAKDLFQEDLNFGRELRVRGFPTMFFVNADQTRELVYGSRPYSAYENAVLKMDPAAKKQAYDTSPAHIFSLYPTLTAKEYSVLTQTPRDQADQALDKMAAAGTIAKWNTKNGAIYRVKGE